MRTASQESAVHDANTQADVCEVNCVHPEAVAQARARLPHGEDVDTASAFLKLVADPTRLKLLSALSTCELCVCDLAAVIGLSESAVSHQLRLLRAGRVVAFRKVGRVAYYRLLDHHVTTLIDSALDHARE
ncbi:ArsR/SmtB family transcription factor [Deinococcus arenicola]|uniref:Metalloregulator ArsR/SmtB family transcription factor n=1 Tax=Deinococcus arenicola TaxID=2994950 RepID=A0ABU4DNP2_9DEIO|nr:metalloregulator ArsR/SmtB family transcription factor [Deinococcus sp. ZS9-10]MDV6374052.1 metalloregulator ArsR/SmtB family transcription factor [Deinococcus sp. ZS9-10]